jgi:hypothetical protein
VVIACGPPHGPHTHHHNAHAAYHRASRVRSLCTPVFTPVFAPLFTQDLAKYMTEFEDLREELLQVQVTADMGEEEAAKLNKRLDRCALLLAAHTGARSSIHALVASRGGLVRPKHMICVHAGRAAWGMPCTQHGACGAWWAMTPHFTPPPQQADLGLPTPCCMSHSQV